MPVATNVHVVTRLFADLRYGWITFHVGKKSVDVDSAPTRSEFKVTLRRERLAAEKNNTEISKNIVNLGELGVIQMGDIYAENLSTQGTRERAERCDDGGVEGKEGVHFLLLAVAAILRELEEVRGVPPRERAEGARKRLALR